MIDGSRTLRHAAGLYTGRDKRERMPPAQPKIMYQVIETVMYPAKYKVVEKGKEFADNSTCNYFRTRGEAQTEADRRNKPVSPPPFATLATNAQNSPIEMALYLLSLR